MFERCRAEVLELHHFFEDWLRGAAPPGALARLERVLDPGFLLIPPSGRPLQRAAVLEQLKGAHGAYRGTGFKIRVENVRLRHATGGSCLLTYEEWQRHEERETARLSTALFLRRAGTPHGVVFGEECNALKWFHLHEVWLPPARAGEARPPGHGPADRFRA